MTNIEEIDSQHKSLIGFINKLHDAIEEGRDEQMLGVVLAELLDYTVNHFTTEEQFMDAYNYPASAAHKLEHELLRNQVLALRKQLDAGRPVATVAVMKFLKEWLTNHILSVDKEMGTFLEARGLK
jgi:hemerythrin